MTKKDYVLIAQAVEHEIAGWKLNGKGVSLREQIAIKCLVDEISEKFTEDNPNFDRNKFLTACGLK